MVVLALPCSIKLQSNNQKVSCSLLASAANATYTGAKQLYIRPITEMSSTTLRSTRPINNRVLLKEYADRKTEETEAVIRRLKTAVERIRESEVDKFTSRLDGELSVEDRRALMEEMSREIVVKFWEKPIQYLTSDDDDDDGILEQKLKHVNFLVDMLERCCSNNQR